MKDKTNEIAHKAAEEIVHKSKGDPDRIEATIRGAIRQAAKANPAAAGPKPKSGKKNPNRFYISE